MIDRLIIALIFILAVQSASAEAPNYTCRDALSTQTWTFGTMGSIIAIRGRATDLGLDGDRAINALQAFCSRHPNVTLGAIIDLLSELRNAMPERLEK